MRKSPIHHHVRTHSRQGYRVRDYFRGQGKRIPLIRRRVLLPEGIRIVKFGGKIKESWIFSEPIKEREIPVMLKEVEDVIREVSQQTGTRMEVVGGVKRRGFSTNDVDILVYPDKLPRSPKETDKWGMPLMKKLCIRVDLLFVNKRREKIPMYDYSYFGVGRLIGHTIPDYAVAMYSPSDVTRVTNGKIRYAYLPSWGYLNKSRVDRTDRLKTERDHLTIEMSRIQEKYPYERWSVGILEKPPLKITDPIKKRYFGMRERRRKIREKLRKMHILEDTPSDIERKRMTIVEDWIRQEEETGKLPEGVEYLSI